MLAIGNYMYSSTSRILLHTQSSVMETLSLNATSHLLDEQSLTTEVESLRMAIAEANEERAQAAEYGLVLLSEKQALRSQYDELSGLYESTKRELDNSVTVGQDN